MTLINQYGSEPEAYIDKGFLESHGINATVQTNSISTLYPTPGSGAGSVLLYVPDSMAEEALKLLSSRK